MPPTLLIFTKAPVPGKVKTRLAKDLGLEAAARAYVEMAGAIRDVILELDGIQVRWVYAPHPDHPDLNWLGLRKTSFWEQGDGGLGERMDRAFARAARQDSGPVCVIGMDSPGLPARRFHEAFDALRTHDLTIGPTEDGGYYLLGTARHRSELFRDIPWSSGQVFDKTLERAAAAGLKTKLLPGYFDVDALAQYERWKRGTSDPGGA